MAFSLTSISQSLSSLVPSQSLPPQRKPPKFGPLISQWDPKSIPTLISLSSSLNEINAITCPSLAYSNTLFFRSGIYNVQVVLDDPNEPEEKLLGRFKRSVFRAGIIHESKRRRFFETWEEKKKRKLKEASKRNRKRRPRPKFSAGVGEETQKKKDDDENDNWELPEGDLPYQILI